MTTFTLRGQRGSQVATVTWTDGHLWGDPDAITMILRLAQAYDGQLFVFSFGAPSSRHNHLHNPWAARELMCMVFMGLPRLVAGSLPRLPDSPPGAIR